MRADLHEWWDTSDPYERLYAIGKYLTRDNPDASFYDLFNFIREDVFFGQPYEEDSDFILGLDWDIDYEFNHGYQ